MTAIEAIASLKPYIEENLAYTDKFQDVCRTAIDALEKQIPKKPKLINEDYTMDGFLIRDFECSSCGNPYVEDSYCQTCGQPLDWSDTM